MTTGRINQVITKPTQPPKQLNSERLAGRLNRIHQMDTFNSHSLECKYPMPSLHLWLRHKSNANPSKKELCIKTQSRQGRVLGVPCKTQNCDQAPETFTIFQATILIEYFTTKFPHSSLNPDGPQGLSRCKQPQDRTQTQLSRVGKQGASIHSAVGGLDRKIRTNPL